MFLKICAKWQPPWIFVTLEEYQNCQVKIIKIKRKMPNYLKLQNLPQIRKLKTFCQFKRKFKKRMQSWVKLLVKNGCHGNVTCLTLPFYFSLHPLPIPPYNGMWSATASYKKNCLLFASAIFQLNYALSNNKPVTLNLIWLSCVSSFYQTLVHHLR